MKQYMLSVHAVEGAPPPAPDEARRMYRDVDALNTELRATGAWVFAGGLHDAGSATVVRADDRGEVLFVDGPFAESKEHLGGFWIIRAPDLDQALAWASRATVACGSPVEVRPFKEPAK